MIIKLTLKSSEYLLIDYIISKLVILFKKFIIKYRGPIYLPIKKKKISILNSPNGDKDSRTFIAIKYYKCIIYILTPNFLLIKKLLFINVSPMINIYMKLLNDI